MATALQARLVEIAQDSSQPKTVRFQGWEYPLGMSLTGKPYFLADVPVDLIERDEEAQPRDYDAEQGKRIAKSIKEKVLMQPILTRYDEQSDRILVTEGQHRWRAMKDELSAGTIPAIVYVNMDRYIALLCGLEANAEDRARALSGGDIARKTHALMQEYAELLRQQNGAEPSEVEVLERMGKTTKSSQNQFILGRIAEDVIEMPGSRITKFISSRQSKEKPITARNLMHFLAKIVRTSAVDSGDPDLRADELANVLRVTNLLADSIYENKWNPATPEDPDHVHAVNISRNKPFMMLGHFVAKAIDAGGGEEASTGACYAPSDRIRWDKVEKEVRKLVTDPIWDQPHVALSRKPDDIKKAIADAMR